MSETAYWDPYVTIGLAILRSMKKWLRLFRLPDTLSHALATCGLVFAPQVVERMSDIRQNDWVARRGWSTRN